MRDEPVFRSFLLSAGAISMLTVAMLLFRIILTDSTRYSFIPVNLALAWAGLFLAWLLVERLKAQSWQSWQNILLTVLWLSFLPNCWYVLTDFIHLFSTGEVSVLYDIVMLASLVFSGFLLGFYSLYLVHKELVKRIGSKRAYQVAELVILLASFAIYLGRLLRWNSWDVLVNPSGLILDVSDRVINPLAHPSAINITALFFIFLSVGYFTFWRLMGTLDTSKRGR